MSSSYNSNEGKTGTNSGAWIIVIVVVVLALLVIPVLLALGFVGFYAFSRVEEAQVEIQALGAPITSTNANVSVNGATATMTSNGVTIVAVAENGQWNNSQVSSTGPRTEAKLDDQTIVLENSRLRINDVDYGVVQQGDQVRLESGRVTINGQERGAVAEAPATTETSEPTQPTAEQAP